MRDKRRSQAGADVVHEAQVAMRIPARAVHAQGAQRPLVGSQRVGDRQHRPARRDRRSRRHRRFGKRPAGSTVSGGPHGEPVVTGAHREPAHRAAHRQRQHAGVEVEDPAQPIADDASDGLGVDEPCTVGDQLEHQVQSGDLGQLVHGLRAGRTSRRAAHPWRRPRCWRRRPKPTSRPAPPVPTRASRGREARRSRPWSRSAGHARTGHRT